MTDTRYCDCDVHGPKRRAYVVCNHILSGYPSGVDVPPGSPMKPDRSLVAHVKPWRDTPEDGAGELCCAKPGEEHTVDELSLMCEDTLMDIGLLLPGETRVQ